MYKLSYYIIIFAIVTALIQKIIFRYGYQTYEENILINERILVISIFDYGENWEKSVRDILMKALYSENIKVGVVIKCRKSKQTINVPIDLQEKVHVMYVFSKNNKDYINKSIEKMYNNEDYITLFLKSKPLKDWDINCIEFTKKNVLITCPPCKKEIATFPTILKNKELLINGSLKKFRSMNTKFVPSVCICQNFLFGSHSIIQDINFKGSMIEETFKLKKKKVKIVVPSFPLINGTYVKSKQVHTNSYSYNKNMAIGISNNPLDDECILKYGSVETANLQVEFL